MLPFLKRFLLMDLNLYFIWDKNEEDLEYIIKVNVFPILAPQVKNMDRDLFGFKKKIYKISSKFIHCFSFKEWTKLEKIKCKCIVFSFIVMNQLKFGWNFCCFWIHMEF